MSTLLLRLAAPMQSWGAGSRFTRRETMREPSKSGVTGLAAAALGRRRDESVADIAALRFGVRIDKRGELLRDYHTAHTETFWKAQRKDGAFVSERFYLTDAKFLAGLEGDPVLLDEIHAALESPVFPLFLGRRSCPPEGRVSLGIRDCDLLEALRTEPRIRGASSRLDDTEPLEIVYEAQGGAILRDMPVSFSQTRRVYGFRGVERVMREEHDPFPLLRKK